MRAPARHDRSSWWDGGRLSLVGIGTCRPRRSGATPTQHAAAHWRGRILQDNRGFWRNSSGLAGARILNKCVAGRAGSPGYVFSGRRWHRRTPAP